MRRGSGLPPGFLTGRVVDEAGAPLAGATVTVTALVSADLHDVVAKCDDAGRFRIGPLLAQASARLYLDAPSHGRERADDLVVFPDSDHDVGDLVVPEGLVATGRVVDEAGRPIAGATITVEPFHEIYEGSIESFGEKTELTSGADGRFATPRLAASMIHLKVNAPGRVHGDAHVQWPGTGLLHDLGTIELRPETPFGGRVVDAAGRGIAGASVTVDIDHIHRVRTEPDGSFVVHGQSEAPHSLAVRSQGYVSVHARRIEDPSRTVVVLESAAQVTGTVVDDATGAPLRPRLVGLGIVRPEHPHAIATVENGEEIADDGSFRVWYQDPGRHVLTVVVEGYAPEHVDLGELARPRARLGVQVRMKREAVAAAARPRNALRVRVTGLAGDASDALASLWHTIPRLAHSRRMVRGVVHPTWQLTAAVARLAADGSFRFEEDGVGTHPFAIRIDRPRAAPLFFGPYTLAADETRELALERTEPALLTGRLVNLPEGFTARMWVVVACEQGVTLTAPAARDGRFSIALPAGRHELRAGTDALRARARPERPDEWHAEPRPEAMAEYERESAELIRPLLEIELAPGERRDVGDVRLPEFLPND